MGRGFGLKIRGIYATALTEVKDGDWFCKHSYFRQAGEVIGDYYSISTPVEVYPDKIRYVDLEIGVVR